MSSNTNIPEVGQVEPRFPGCSGGPADVTLTYKKLQQLRERRAAPLALPPAAAAKISRRL